MNPIYLDNATTLPPSQTLLQRVMQLYQTEWASPSSPYDLGQNALMKVVESLEDIQKSLSLPDDVDSVITSSGAEATTQAVQSLLQYQIYEHGKNHILLPKFHDAATIMAVEAEKRDGAAFYTHVEVDQFGLLTKENLLSAIGPRTAFLAFPLVHPLLGIVQPIEEIYEVTKERNIPCLVDISNAIGTTMVDFSSFDTFYYVARGEAIGVPSGMAGIVLRMAKAPALQPLIYGNEFDKSYRGGPMNLSGAVGLAHAIAACKEKEVIYCTEVRALQQFFQSKLSEKLGVDALSFPFSSHEMAAPHILCVLFHGVKNEMLLYLLNKKKVYATIGGAGFQNLTYILENPSFSINEPFSGISFGLSSMTTENEIVEACERIADCYTMLKKVSPL